MGASSGWNLVARRPPRARVAPVSPTRHLVSVPCIQSGEAESSSDERPTTPGLTAQKRESR